MKINRWENGRTLIIGILDQKDKKVVHSHVIEISESMNPDYFRDGLGYLRQADAERDVPTLFDFLTEAG